MFMSNSFKADSKGNRFRARRIAMFNELVTEVIARNGHCRILDVGGTHEYWRAFGDVIDWQRVTIVLLNLTRTNEPDTDHISQVVGDACDMSQFGDMSFDLVHSNSVIEHVGLFNRMEAMAREIRRIAPAYFVQTPSFWFPIEAHSRFPFLQFLPEPLKVSLIMRRRLGYWPQAADVGEATRTAQSAILLHKRQMHFLFPDAEIRREKVFFLTKSYIAVKRTA